MLKLEREERVKSKRRYRTKRTAELANDIEYPKSLAITTYKPYQYATSLFQNGNAYLQPGIDTSNLKFQEGKLFFEDETGLMKKISEVELINNFKTKEPLTKINGLVFLRVYYSIILKIYMEAIKKNEPLPKSINFYLPDLAEYLGYPRNVGSDTIQAIISQMMSFHNTLGVMTVDYEDNRVGKSYYPIFLFTGYDDTTNTIGIYSPYVYKVIDTIYKEAIKVNLKTKQPELNNHGEPIHLPSHSFIIKPSIFKEKNNVAVENVFIIVQVIEKAGNYIPRIKARTIIERNSFLNYKLQETETKHKTQLLQRTFKKTWELLSDQTRLKEKYRNIQLPDPLDKQNIPSVKNLDLVFSFPHEGKMIDVF